MARPKKTQIATIPAEFVQYSEVLAVQLDNLWKQSLPIKVTDQINVNDNVTLTTGNFRRSLINFQKAMPYLMDSLPEELLTDFKRFGLDALIDKNNRDKFEWELNKQVADKLSLKAAASADIGFFNILALHTSNVQLKPLPFELHLKFKPYSIPLARQIAHMYERATLGDNSSHTLNKMRLYHSIHSLNEMLPTLWVKLPADVLKRFIELGFDCLTDNDDYDIIEHLGVHESINRKNLPTKFDDALTNLRSMHLNQTFLPSSHVNLKRQSIDISRAMSLSYQEFYSLKVLIETVGSWYESDGNKSDATISDNLNSSVNHIQKLLERGLKNLSEGSTLQVILKENSDIVHEYISSFKNPPHAFNAFLKRIAPETYGKYQLVDLRNKEQFFLYIQSISFYFTKEYRRYLDSQNTTAQKLSYKKSFAKYLYAHQKNQKISTVIQILKAKGIRGLAENEGYGFFQLSKHVEIVAEEESMGKRHPIRAALEMYNYINNSNVKLNHLLPFTMVFENENDGTVSSVDFSFIASKYKRVFENFLEYAEVNKSRTYSNTNQLVTVKNHLTVTQNIFKKYHDTLNAGDIELLSNLGIYAFAENNSRLLKHFRQMILRDTNSKIIEASYAVAMQAALNQVVSFFDVGKSDTYRVSNSKTQKLAARNSKRHLYAFEQVVQIAYAIEKCLRRDNLTKLQELSLHAARIFLKTGWNLTPTLELDCDDLVYFDTTFQGNKTAAVRLFKRRAKYKTDWARFSTDDKQQLINADTALNEYETGKVTAAVISNLEFIRQMTIGIAEKHTIPNLQRRIFAYQDRNKIKILNGQSFTSCINALLKSEGINESFSVTKIRKKGMNYTYRKVAKNFERYQKAGMHTPQAFYQYYLKMDGAETEENLTRATTVMGDFFLRDIPDNVIFVSKPPAGSKQTPTGRCIQTTNAAVVTEFKNKNRKFLNEDEISGCADFGACLFCVHFRCIADAEHVWRLLSFEKVVIQRMISASYSIGGNDGSDQQRSIQRIQLRVKHILDDLAELKSEAIENGRQIFKEHGVHPDWELV